MSSLALKLKNEPSLLGRNWDLGGGGEVPHLAGVGGLTLVSDARHIHCSASQV